MPKFIVHVAQCNVKSAVVVVEANNATAARRLLEADNEDFKGTVLHEQEDEMEMVVRVDPHTTAEEHHYRTLAQLRASVPDAAPATSGVPEESDSGRSSEVATGPERADTRPSRESSEPDAPRPSSVSASAEHGQPVSLSTPSIAVTGDTRNVEDYSGNS